MASGSIVESVIGTRAAVVYGPQASHACGSNANQSSKWHGGFDGVMALGCVGSCMHVASIDCLPCEQLSHKRRAVAIEGRGGRSRGTLAEQP